MRRSGAIDPADDEQTPAADTTYKKPDYNTPVANPAKFERRTRRLPTLG